MTEANNLRDARRRRRILQQGSDRLAFIQGRIQTLPPPESQPLFQPQPPTTHQDSSDEISQLEEPRSFDFISLRDVTNAVDASRFTRLCCSIIVALLVVASCLGFSLIKTIISFRPLYLVLLTNSSFVVAKIISGKQRGSDERLRRRRNNASASASADSSDQYAQLAKTLEIGMVLKTVADAVFIDCAVYAIVLICSLSLVHH
ncbi:unnamed protein product [Vicia faba]|uniref:Transmembrane protein n=1 Tax=Vicia faba TaxID=3906 RepID=A0AAV1AQL3_VICFA|nr:unnamed protein product [Vicia faba]